ncbi:MAG: DNA mismatch repair endonuclease MutL [Oscillospiraceae bacterium]|nr:DNA mismatch repair endonuclease MutL [Oscillospiraceae bacterium]
MAKIQVLEHHVAELIAAGEVVERPASVVKELVENAIDAQSKTISVSIERGGMRCISVRDDGSGIASDELPTAFLRHATSKVRSADDLGCIETLGFRGEALAAICAVSRVEIQTRQRGADTGCRLCVEGGDFGSVEDAGTPDGTVITVRDLFYNTPARLKFMRKDSAETAAINGLMQHLALSHPDIAFRFDKDGVNAFRTPGDGNLLSAIYAAYGREFARSLLPVDGRGGDIVVSGFVTSPAYGRGSRAMQMFFLNGRFIKSQLLTAALEEAYRNQMLKDKFPGCVLSVSMPAHMVDVNVHPAKTEVKFSREQDVFRAVYHTVLDDLNAKGGTVTPQASQKTVTPQASRKAVSEPAAPFFRNMDAKTYRQEVTNAAGKPWMTTNRFADVETIPVPATPAPIPNATPATVSDAPELSMTPDTLEVPPGFADTPEASTTPDAPEQRDIPATPKQSDTPTPKMSGLPGQRDILPEPRVAPWRIAGEVLATYIICEDASGNLYLIDKHAAHERIRFDALQAGDAPPMPQTLLKPVAVELSREDAALLLDNLDTLETLGFSCEDFGGNTLLVREIPSDIDPGDITATLEELSEDLRGGHSTAERREALYRTMACKSAIRGGEDTSPRELRALVDKVQSGEVRYCPHGRPVAAKITKFEIEKLFKRV